MESEIRDWYMDSCSFVRETAGCSMFGYVWCIAYAPDHPAFCGLHPLPTFSVWYPSPRNLAISPLLPGFKEPIIQFQTQTPIALYILLVFLLTPATLTTTTTATARNPNHHPNFSDATGQADSLASGTLVLLEGTGDLVSR